MTILTLDRKELEKYVGKIDAKVQEKITMMGSPVEEVSDEVVSVEVFPNRPDLLSMQGFARSLNQYLGKKGVSKFDIAKPEKDYKVKVDKSVRKVRPHTACAIVKGLKLDDEKIKEIIDVQEKLHLTIGRKRKKIAIGIYPLEKIKLPIRYMAEKPDKIKFVPLESNGKELTGAQILRQHPTGRDYADLLKDAELFPIFIDADDNILSMPPIINSDKTGRIDIKTKDVFIECSGFNIVYIKKCLNILVTALADMGGKIYSMEISGENDFISPNLDMGKLEFKIEDINKTLGLELQEKEVKMYLERMGVGLEREKVKGVEKLFALIPAYRTDILHWIDLAEEVAMAYGYENFKPILPSESGVSTVAEEDKMSRAKKATADILSGLGLLEVSSFHLAKKKDVKKMHFEMKNEEFIEIEESKTEYDVLRIDLLTNLMKILSENSDSAYPQKIFEIGRVFEKKADSETGIGEKERLSIAIADEKVNFTEIRQVFDYLSKMMNFEYKVEEVENGNFISGRVGKIIVKGKEVGIIGEIAPRVLKNWKIGVPVSALEVNLELILG